MKSLNFKFKRTYFAMPYFFLMTVFVVIPLIILLVWAFKGVDGGFTFSNFGKFFTEKDTLRVVGRSFLIALITTVVCLIIAYPIALILTNSKINKNLILILLFIMPMWINSLLRTYAIKTVFGMLGMQNAYVNVTIALVYDFFPFMLLPIYTILVSMDKSLIEASTDLGGGAFKTFLKIQLPLTVPGIISGILMVFMPTVSTFAISDIIAESANFYLFGNLINMMFESKGTYNIGSAYAFILLAIIAISMIVANKFTDSKKGIKGGAL